jgi:hypothetical protein
MYAYCKENFLLGILRIWNKTRYFIDALHHEHFCSFWLTRNCTVLFRLHFILAFDRCIEDYFPDIDVVASLVLESEAGTSAHASAAADLVKKL